MCRRHDGPCGSTARRSADRGHGAGGCGHRRAAESQHRPDLPESAAAGSATSAAGSFTAVSFTADFAGAPAGTGATAFSAITKGRRSRWQFPGIASWS